MFRLFFCLLLVWGSNKFERDFSLFCLVFWAFRFPLKIVFQGYDYQSHSYTQFACLHMFQVYIHRVPFLVTRAFQDHFFNTDTRTFVLRLLIFFWKYFAQGSLSSLFPVQHFITLPQILCIHLRNRDSSRSSSSSHARAQGCSVCCTVEQRSKKCDVWNFEQIYLIYNVTEISNE